MRYRKTFVPAKIARKPRSLCEIIMELASTGKLPLPAKAGALGEDVQVIDGKVVVHSTPAGVRERLRRGEKP